MLINLISIAILCEFVKALRFCRVSFTVFRFHAAYVYLVSAVDDVIRYLNLMGGADDRCAALVSLR
nr:hypothetical protein [uncultured Agathobaculum sp.]